MGKNIKIIPSEGVIKLSGDTSSTIDLGHNQSNDELKFSGVMLRVSLYKTFKISMQERLPAV